VRRHRRAQGSPGTLVPGGALRLVKTLSIDRHVRAVAPVVGGLATDPGTRCLFGRRGPAAARTKPGSSEVGWRAIGIAEALVRSATAQEVGFIPLIVVDEVGYIPFDPGGLFSNWRNWPTFRLALTVVPRRRGGLNAIGHQIWHQSLTLEAERPDARCWLRGQRLRRRLCSQVSDGSPVQLQKWFLDVHMSNNGVLAHGGFCVVLREEQSAGGLTRRRLQRRSLRVKRPRERSDFLVSRLSSSAVHSDGRSGGRLGVVQLDRADAT
jgi:hypothetical protein